MISKPTLPPTLPLPIAKHPDEQPQAPAPGAATLIETLAPPPIAPPVTTATPTVDSYGKCLKCFRQPPNEPRLREHHLRFCEPHSPSHKHSGDPDRLKLELDTLDASTPPSSDEIKPGHLRQGRPTYFYLMSLKPTERAEFLAELQLRYSNRFIGAELGISEAILRIWALVGNVIGPVREALDLGEGLGLSLTTVKKFYYTGQGSYARSMPRPPIEQLQLLAQLRGKGRGKR